ncbi:MAG TPA: hypothetical protein VKV23_01185 [Acidimicrobiales bacterium]|nr:hypothetical protein [Acidimicrobiales bacterium]
MGLRSKAAAAAAVLAVALVGGNAAAGASVRAHTASPVTISIFGGASTSMANFNTNWYTQWVKSTFGITFNADLVPSTTVSQKEPVLMESGAYPDALFNANITNDEAELWGSQGLLIPLNGLIKKYAPNVWHTIQTDPTYREKVVGPNGKIYALGPVNGCEHCLAPYDYWINVKYLQQYHLNLPRTTAQFEHVLEVFKDHGLVPLAGSTTGYGTSMVVFLMNSFVPLQQNPVEVSSAGSSGSNLIDVQNNKTYFAPATKGWEQGLEYLHTLYSKGLFSSDVLTQPNTAVARLVARNDLGVAAISNIAQDVPNYTGDQQWVMLPPLRGPHGVQSISFEPQTLSSGLTMAITNHASKAQAIALMKLVNNIFTLDGNQRADYGPPGEYWTPAKKGQRGETGLQARWNNDTGTLFSSGTLQNGGWQQFGIYDNSALYRNLQAAASPYSKNGLNTLLDLEVDLAMLGHQPPQEFPGSNIWVPLSEESTFNTEQANIDAYVSEWLGYFITGSKSLPRDWNSYLAGLNALGLKQYMQIATKAMGAPIDGAAREYQQNKRQISFLLHYGHVSALMKKYLIQSGAKPSDFAR